MADREPIGPHHFKWADDVCKRAIEDPSGISDRALEFVEDIADKLDRYGAEVWLSEAQINWLEDIDRKLEEQGR